MIDQIPIYVKWDYDELCGLKVPQTRIGRHGQDTLL